MFDINVTCSKLCSARTGVRYILIRSFVTVKSVEDFTKSTAKTLILLNAILKVVKCCHSFKNNRGTTLPDYTNGFTSSRTVARKFSIRGLCVFAGGA